VTKVKICGIRRECDIEYVNLHLPDYIGFIFAPSKRRVTREYTNFLTTKLDKRIKKAGVFVNEQLEEVIKTAKECSLDFVQIHGDETPEYISCLKSSLKVNTKIWKAVRVKNEDSIKSIEKFDADSFVLDAYSEDSYGGLGKVFDWKLAVEAKKYGNIILAGGLNLQNVAEAIKIVQPFAVDVSSGVESEGVKDEYKVKKFIYSARYNVY